MKKIIVTCHILLLFGLTTIYAQYAIKSGVMGIGGQIITDSAHYKIYGTAGQSFIGQVGNNSHINKAGYWYISGVTPTNLEDPFGNLPVQFELSQNYPNPFNPVTNIKFALPTATQVRIDLFNVLGKRVHTLLDSKKPAGYHTITFDARRLASGIYFYTIKTKNFYQSKRMLLIK